MADVEDLKSSGLIARAGSNPASGTKQEGVSIVEAPSAILLHGGSFPCRPWPRIMSAKYIWRKFCHGLIGRFS
jgi:hypothetical protein